MTFGNLKCNKGIKALNNYLKDRSYINGYQASKVDLAVFDALGCTEKIADSIPHVMRWYNHIKSYSKEEKAKLPGVKKIPDSLCSDEVKASAPAGKKDKDSDLPGSCEAKAPAASAPATKKEEDDDLDLFGSDEEEDAEAARVREERLKAYSEKKSKKPALIAKSSIVLEVKPWDDETDMKVMESNVRTIIMDGLVWGASKLVPVGYGINKLQIMCVVEDEKVSVDLLTEEIQKFEDYVQSVDIAAFNKI